MERPFDSRRFVRGRDRRAARPKRNRGHEMGEGKQPAPAIRGARRTISLTPGGSSARLAV
jgi:hypothetical protein